MEPSSGPTPDPADAFPVRRGFFRWVTYGLGAVAGAVVSFPFVGYLLGSRKRPAGWVSLGKAEGFAPGETRLVTFENPIRQPWDGLTAHIGVYVRNEGKDGADKDRFLVLAVNCAPLGCPVSWFPQSGLFMCPCHGGVYYANGERASGPPPRGLFRCQYKVEGGVLKVLAPHYPTLQHPLVEDDKGHGHG